MLLPIRPLLFLLASASLGLAQTAVLPPVSGMTPEKMGAALNDPALATGGRAIRSQLFTDAIAAGRIDLIRPCLLNRHTMASTFRALVALPGNDLKSKVSIMMLRMPTLDCWPVSGLRVSSAPLPTDVSEPFISTVAKLLPGETLIKEMLAPQSARDQLANKLLVALASRHAVISAEEKALLEPSPVQPLPSQGKQNP